MANKLGECFSIGKDDFLQRLRADSCTEMNNRDLKTGAGTGALAKYTFVYLKIIDVHKNDRVGGRAFVSFPFVKMNIEGNEESCGLRGILHLEKDSYGGLAKRLDVEMRIVVRGFRFATDVETCFDDLVSIILDRKCPKGKIYILNAKKRPRSDSTSLRTGLASTPGSAGQTSSGKKRSRSDGSHSNGSPDDNTTSASKKTPAYDYTALADIGHSLDQRVNVYGVVLWFKYIDTSSLKFTITDPSLAERKGVTCILNAYKADGDSRLPDIRQGGDIVRIHRIMVDHSNDEYCLRGRMGEFGQSAVVWDGGVGQNVTARMSSSRNYTVVESDYETVRRLRLWLKEGRGGAVSTISLPVCQDATSDLVTLGRFPRGKFKNIAGQVIGLWKSSTRVVLRISDGTKGHEKAIKVFDTDEKANCLSIDHDLNQFVGTCTGDVFVYDQYMDQALQLRPRDFVFIVNVHLALVQGSDSLAYTVHGGPKGPLFGRGLFPLESTSELANKIRRRLVDLAENAPAAAPVDQGGTGIPVVDLAENAPTTAAAPVDEGGPGSPVVDLQDLPDTWSSPSQPNFLPLTWSAATPPS